MVRLADRHKFEPFGARALAEIAHVEKRDPMAAADQFTAESSERMDVTGNGRTDDAEMHSIEGLPQNGRGVKRSAKRLGALLCCPAARIRGFCSSKSLSAAEDARCYFCARKPFW